MNNRPNALAFLGTFLDRREWVYLLSLLVPLVIYNLSLKALSVSSVPGLTLSFSLMKSDVFFNLGYALFWVGLLAVVQSINTLRKIVLVLFHVGTILIVTVTTSAHQYFLETGTTLDYGILALWLPDLSKVAPVLLSSTPLWVWALLVAILLYVAFGPLLLTQAMDRWRGWPERDQAQRRGGRARGVAFSSFLVSFGFLLLAFGFVFLSLLVGAKATDFTSAASVSFVRDPFVNLALTGFKEVASSSSSSSSLEDEGDDSPSTTTDQTAEHPAAHATLAQTSQTQKRNVVLIHLESTRSRSVTPYNEDLKTTPFLEELAENQSLLAEQAYTTVPHTSKASVSVNCGIEPHLVQPTTEAGGGGGTGGIPVPCLASLLKEQGYKSVFFQSSTKDFEDFEGLVKNFGYEEYYSSESMDKEDFKQTNYFGYEDDIMLAPSQEWLEENKDEPFVAEYLTGTGHHDYQCHGLRYGDENFSNEEPLNSYLNCLHYQDEFLQNLFNQYKKLGLYNNTIFVIYGDHGEGFGEHGRFQHDDTIWEEGLRVPLLIHAPGLLKDGGKVRELSNHTDILPTVVDLLGYEVKGGEYPGYSLVRPVPEDRTLKFSCFHERACLASIEGDEKYIYHYDNQPDEVFDLSNDPSEKNNLAESYSKEELDKRRKELLKWRSTVNATY